MHYLTVPFSLTASYWFGECIFGREPLEQLYERITGVAEELGGPPYSNHTPFAPNYICYTSGNNVEEDSR